MKLELWRDKSTDKCTHGNLYAGGSWVCHTLEDVVRLSPNGNNIKEKIPGETAIPAGEYPVTMYYWDKHNDYFPLLHDVPNFTGIFIHSGNVADDTKGCILVGMRKDEDSILDSLKALKIVMKKIKAALELGPVTVKIIDPIVASEVL